MRIAFDHQAFTLQSYGGISRYYTSLAYELLMRGETVKVFAGLHRNNYISELPNNAVSGVRLNKYPLKTVRAFQWLNTGIGEAKVSLWKPDIIHKTYYSTSPDLFNSALKITTVYDMIHELFSKDFGKADKTTHRKKIVCQSVDHIICISHSTKRDLVDLFNIDEAKVSVVHLGVDLSVFQKPKIKNEFENRPYLLYVGARGGYKNFDKLLDAAAASPIVKNKILLVAFGGGQFNKKEKMRIQELGFNAGQVVQVSGTDDLLASLYAHARCFIYPSLYEGFGLPPLEAMAAGCPVVSSNTSSMPEVTNKAASYFDPTNVEELRSAIDSVVSSDQRRHELVQLGYDNIKLFSWKKCANETLDIYKGLAVRS